MVWWYGPCAAWSCCASMSCKDDATSIYELSELISAGEGTDGHQVYRATHRETGDVVALKVLPRSFLTDSKQRRHMRREIHVLTKLNHPNVVRLYDVYESSNTVEIAFELAQGGQVLRRVLEPHASVFVLSEAELSHAFADIVQGLIYLHALGWVHGDIRPEHILYSEIDGASKAMLVDFGCAGPPATFAESLYRERGPSDPRFLPPWLRQRNPTALAVFPSFNHAAHVDLWALGVCLYVMLFAQFPDTSSVHSPTLTFPPEFGHVSRAARDLLTRVLTSAPRDNLTYVQRVPSSDITSMRHVEGRADELADHPWLHQPSVAPRCRWNPYILALHEQFVQNYSNTGNRHASDKTRMPTSCSPPDASDKPRPSWVSTDGVLVLDSLAMHSADAFMHQADMEMLDTIRRSEDIPLTEEETEAAKSDRGWRLMWKGLGLSSTAPSSGQTSRISPSPPYGSVQSP
ncbi:CAMK protein kinase, variant 1 [Aphanomyces invadans]|uniref:CAMK protein kinase, variant 1 n=1 Tax=Aphanomyces invadans TaxID=157072 RepID=A0A024UC31_9STRA|nr:CAMK protein kinase, variant 1 [Aphanomyces invadans]ETW03951.1 CAMK protein kinase, variant 1 [Aphanomyces invadans]|eukprot:XP_008866907.1 CAMK protein kinase, variant 1 [Aphanomyces invadans]